MGLNRTFMELKFIKDVKYLNGEHVFKSYLYGIEIRGTSLTKSVESV